MSGHSKWSKIKRKKGVNDIKRGAAFTKIIRKITVAARDGGDPNTNVSLRLAIDLAKSMNMPQDNVDRAIKKGTGELSEGGSFESVTYEAIFPNNLVFMIACTTDNKNRTVAEIRRAVEDLGGNIGASGSVSWQFELKGIISLFLEKARQTEKFGAEVIYEPLSKDTVISELLEIEGIEDFETDIVGAEEKEGVRLLVDSHKVTQIGKEIDMHGYRIEEVTLGFIPTNPLKFESLDETKFHRIVEVLENLDDVDKVWPNIM